MNNSEDSRIGKTLLFVSSQFKKLGLKLAYAVLLLVYAYKRKETPRWAKNIVLGALAYLLTPVDFIPDLTPFLGFTDDFGMIIASLGSIALYVNDEVKDQAKTKLKTWFPSFTDEDLVEVDSKL